MRIVRTDLGATIVTQNALEQRSENGRVDLAPIELQAVSRMIGLACAPVSIRQRRVGRAPHPRALGRGFGATSPHFIASRSGEQQRVLRRGQHARQLQARRLTGGVGSGP